ncbi:hypothetical protein B0H17DRAFT_1126189 [Mycena rosella]|uniref:Uncharacterized protein n=1 Tax=Mycena rosella TaxID=1033263 RepID=A0AAD7GU22_MYCRO|nr:hypothetical protein B0H17DRAFT_1126189 [Mycena rosella]
MDRSGKVGSPVGMAAKFPPKTFKLPCRPEIQQGSTWTHGPTIPMQIRDKVDSEDLAGLEAVAPAIWHHCYPEGANVRGNPGGATGRGSVESEGSELLVKYAENHASDQGMESTGAFRPRGASKPEKVAPGGELNVTANVLSLSLSRPEPMSIYGDRKISGKP